MKAQLWAKLLISFSAAAGLNLFGQPNTPINEAFSENRKFSMEVTESEINKPLLAVFAREGDQKRLLWSRPVGPQTDLDDPGMNPFSGGRPFRRLLSNDGSLVILRPQYAQGEEAFIRVLTRQGGDTALNGDDVAVLLAEILDSDFQTGSNEKPLELLLEAEKPPLFAWWIPDATKWLVIDLQTLKPTVASGEMEKRLDALGLAKAREMVRAKDGGGGLSRVISSIRQKAADVLPGVVTPETPSSPEDTFSAYRFLASKRNPEDRKLVEKLLEAKVPGFTSNSPFQDSMRISFFSYERTIGEALLTQWDGLKPLEQEATTGLNLGPASRRFGSIEGTVFLPFKTPDQGGQMTLFLIPAESRPDNFATDPEVARAVAFFNQRFAGPPGQQTPTRHDKIKFTAATLTPGEYRFKAVWDRRAPGPGLRTSNNGQANPGDYESALSKVFKVGAGERIGGIEIDCTNRVGASELFRLDEAWAARNPASRDTSEAESSMSPGIHLQQRPDRDLVRRPVSDWMARTNENTGDLHVNRVRLTESYDLRTGATNRQLRIRFAAPAPKNRNEWTHYEARLEDEHGCRFNAGTGSGRRLHDLYFSNVPYGAREMKLVIVRQNNASVERPDNKLEGASFQLKNLCEATPENWTPDAIPAKRPLDIVTVELTKINPAAPEYSAAYLSRIPPGYHPELRQPNMPRNSFSFFQGTEPNAGWRKISGTYRDRWGNENPSLSAFCSAEEFFKLVTHFAREPDKELFTKDELWEVPIAKIPGPGENVPLNLTNKLQDLELRLFSVSGTGEFTYENGQLVSATNRLSDGGMNARFMPGNRAAPQPKLALVSEQRSGMPVFYPGGRRPPGPVTIAAKIPHLACHIPEQLGGSLFALLEEDTSVPEPMNAPPQMPHGGYYGGPRVPSALKFLPLDYRAGEADAKLTFIVQKPRSAEFIIKVPASQRSSAANQ